MIDATFQARIFPMLESVFEDQVSPVVSGKLYAVVAPPKTEYPCGVYYSPDSGGRDANLIALNGWEGLLMFKASSKSKHEAWVKLLEISERVTTLTSPSGYIISTQLLHPIWLPVERMSDSNVYSVGILTKFAIYKEGI